VVNYRIIADWEMGSACVGPPGNFPLLNYSTIFFFPNRPRSIAFYLRISLVVARFAAGRRRFELFFMWLIV